MSGFLTILARVCDTGCGAGTTMPKPSCGHHIIGVRRDGYVQISPQGGPEYYVGLFRQVHDGEKAEAVEFRRPVHAKFVVDAVKCLIRVDGIGVESWRRHKAKAGDEWYAAAGASEAPHNADANPALVGDTEETEF
jgi:hypothetical protein